MKDEQRKQMKMTENGNEKKSPMTMFSVTEIRYLEVMMENKLFFLSLTIEERNYQRDVRLTVALVGRQMSQLHSL